MSELPARYQPMERPVWPKEGATPEQIDRYWNRLERWHMVQAQHLYHEMSTARLLTELRSAERGWQEAQAGWEKHAKSDSGNYIGRQSGMDEYAGDCAVYAEHIQLIEAELRSRT